MDEPTNEQGASLTGRRAALRVLGSLGLGAVAAACMSTGEGGALGGGASSTTVGDGACARIPEETAGPFPGDGSNGPNVLNQGGVVRRDIRSSYGSSSTIATGIPLTIRLTIVDTGAGCEPLEGAAVYLWHCDQQGRYSLYSNGVTGENYLRGVQVADANGQLEFVTIFPGCYSGRWPHAHFEVFPTLASLSTGAGRLATSQLALPKEACDEVYATSGYTGSASNLSRISLQSDGIFSDGVGQQMVSITGGTTSGYTAFLTVPV